MNDVTRRALRSSLFGILALAALLFIPAGTFNYWQAWLFMAVFVCTSDAITVYLAIHDPKLLERRMKVGPRAESEPAQEIIMLFAMLGFIAMLVVPALDHRFGWSSVPASVSVLADVLIALAFLFICVQGKQLRRLDDSDRRRPDRHFHGSLCARAPSDVCWGIRHARRRAARARLVVGAPHRSRQTSCADLEAARRGTIPAAQACGLCGLSNKGDVS